MRRYFFAGILAATVVLAGCRGGHPPPQPPPATTFDEVARAFEAPSASGGRFGLIRRLERLADPERIAVRAFCQAAEEVARGAVSVDRSRFFDLIRANAETDAQEASGVAVGSVRGIAVNAAVDKLEAVNYFASVSPRSADLYVRACYLPRR